jgi:hypothetical protein
MAWLDELRDGLAFLLLLQRPFIRMMIDMQSAD